MYQRRQGAVKGSAHEDGTPPDAQTIVIEDEGLRAGFTQLPNYVFRIRGLSHGAKLTYALLLSYAWQKDSCFPGQQTLAADLDVSVRSVGDYLRELQDRALIRVQRRGLGKTNVYHILRLEAAPGPRPPLPSREGAAPHRAALPHQSAPPGGAPHHAARPVSRQDRQDLASPDRQDPADLDPQPGAILDPRRGSAAETQKRATKKHQGTQKHSPEEKDPPQQPAAAADLIRVVLSRWGIVEPGIVGELCGVPSDVLRQAAALEEHLAAGRPIANPAGWLIEAVRAGYRRPAVGAEGMSPRPWPPSSTAWPVPASPSGHLSLLDTPTEAEAGRDAPPSLWAAIKDELRDTTTAANFRRWFAPLVAVREEPGTLVLGIVGEHEREWLDQRLRGTVERAAVAVLGQSPVISFIALAPPGGPGEARC